MKMKENWKYRICSLISFLGLIMVLLTVGPLIDYHEQTSAYIEKMEPLLDQLQKSNLNIRPDPQVTNADLNKISNEIIRTRFFDKPVFVASRVPKHPNLQFFIGFSLLLLGLYYSEKYKPKPKEKTPDPDPSNPWDSVPAPELKKSSSGGD